MTTEHYELTDKELDQIAEAGDTYVGPPDPMFVKGKWYEVDTSALDGEALDAFQTYQRHNESMRAARLVMEGHFGHKAMPRIPNGLVPMFAYRFGKISFSPDVPRARSAKSGGKVTL